MKRIIILLAIFCLASILRLYQLGENPPSLYWDEASISYNAYSILTTGADEYGVRYPLSFRSFDDYKPPLYIYLAVPSIAVFGWNEFAVRFPSAFFGILTIIISYFLLKELFRNKNIHFTFLNTLIDVPLVGTFLLAISPWHLQFSRPAFEANVGLFFLLSGLLFFFKGLRNYRYTLISALAFAISMYAYHSFRVVVPLVILSVSALFLKEGIKSTRGIQKIALFYGLIFVSVIPILMSLLTQGGASSRLSEVTIFNVPDLLDRSIRSIEYDLARGDIIGSIFHNRRIIYLFEIIKGYLDHFNLNFLFLIGDSGRHHHAVDMGMLYLWEMFSVFFGVYQLAKNLDKKIILIFLLLFIAPLPSAVTTGTPHAVRSILMLFPLVALSAYGIVFIISKIISIKSNIKKITAFILITVIFLSNFFYYIHQYFVHTPVEYGDFWQDGYKELYEKVKRYESRYDTVIVSYEYDHPDTYYLLYNKFDPAAYQKLQINEKVQIERFESRIGKFHFKRIDWGKDKNTENALIVVTPGDIPKDTKNIIDEVKFLNGKTAFQLVESENINLPDEANEK